MSEVKTDKLSPRTASGTLTLGTSGDTFTIPSGVTLTNNGTASGFAEPSGLSSVQTFTSSGTWTRPSGITKVICYVTGGGGNGGTSTGNNWYAGSGGGAGGTAIKFLDVSSISSSTITVGAATGSSSWADGTNTITGNAGTNGPGSSFPGGAGGTATNGDLNITGGDGLTRINTSLGGQGGSSYWGGSDSYAQAGTPSAATTYGTGGSASSSGDTSGGAGAPGIVYIQEFK